MVKALELSEQGIVGDDFRALLETDKVTDICANASPICDNDIADGDVSKTTLQESLRNNMFLIIL